VGEKKSRDERRGETGAGVYCLKSSGGKSRHPGGMSSRLGQQSKGGLIRREGVKIRGRRMACASVWRRTPFAQTDGGGKGGSG